ncbi:MAG: hypothetical protein KDB53_17040, partial [Planctomycetes bacterium]|nr:hypothetical protein [Planctomycetota bacterium]
LALARIMMRRPQVVLGELPERDAESTLMLDALKSLSKQQGTTVVLATKRPDLAAQADRCIDLRRSASRLRA